MNQSKVKRVIAVNPGRHEWEIKTTLEAGLSLLGWEVKSLRLGGLSLKGAMIGLGDKGVYLVGSQIRPYKYAPQAHGQVKRSRPLLLHRKEINKLIGWQTAGWRLIPLKAYWKGRLVKLEIGVGRKLKRWQKKEKLKNRDLIRDQQRELKQRW